MAQKSVLRELPWGHLTQAEQDMIWADVARARRRALSEARARARTEGQRIELLRLIEMLGGAPHAAAFADSDLDDLRAEVARLVARREG